MGGFVSKVRQGLVAAKKAAAAAAAALSRAAAKAYEALKRAAAAAMAKLVALFSGLPRWAQIGIPVAAVAVLVAGLLALTFCCLLPTGAAAGGAMIMVAPGAGGVMVLRSAFVAHAALYFSLLHSAGPAAAVASVALVA